MTNNAAVVTAEAPKVEKHKPFVIDVLQRLVREKPLGTLGGCIVIILLLVGILAPVLAPYGYNEIILSDRLQNVSASHWMGTDNLGRDMLSRVIYGARISVIVGLCVATLNMIISIMIGSITGYLGGKVDIVTQRLVDAIMCFPQLVIVLTVISLLGPGMFQVIMVLGIWGALGGRVRIVRSAVISIKENVYVEAARAIGAKNLTIVFKHILPNILPVAIVGFTMDMGMAILTESTLSFLGYGIPPPMPSWGGMLSGSGRQYMLLAPWMCLWPGLCLSIVVYGINMLGDGLRDVLDPRLRGGLGRYEGAKKKKPETKKA
jgi:peptide/nickel transport system permease protein